MDGTGAPPWLLQPEFSEHAPGDILRQLVDSAVAALEGCDGASLNLLGNGGAGASVGSNDLVSTIDSYQAETGEGPCVACVSTGVVEHFDAEADDGRWPDFGQMARGRGILGCLAVPLVVHGAVLGALNCYSRERSFSAAAQDAAASIARQASFLLANLKVYGATVQKVERLNRLLGGSEDVVAQAVGVLMARHDLSPPSALSRLEARAAREGRSIESLSREIVDSIS
ncbi:MAG: GAF and ANTAR domain-containing protein [Actinomycetota bacterium]|nr:GAF and ANTAR domain-containing protein [Actinomycetota bacterium]